MSSYKERLPKIREIARRHEVPFDLLLPWLVMEDMANLLLFKLIVSAGKDAMFKLLVEIQELTETPLTEEDLKTYKRRFGIYRDLIKKRLE